jgi:hypothetical protein
MGNTAPLLNSSIKALSFEKPQSILQLPCEQASFSKDFPQAGILVRCTPRYYCIVGVSTGGVTKIYDRRQTRLVLDDCGLLGKTNHGLALSTQMSADDQGYRAEGDKLEFWGGFYPIKSSQPSPAKFLLLRLMNLTIMRIGFLNELVKKLLVSLLISGSRPLPLKHSRTLEFQPDHIRITDRVERTGRITLQHLSYGGKFSSIHMASSRYFQPGHFTVQNFAEADVTELNRSGVMEFTRKVEFRE